MTHSLPQVPAVSLAAVDDDVFGPDPLLKLALLGVLPTPPEEARGLNLEVADALSVVVEQAEAVLLHDLLVGFFDHLGRWRTPQIRLGGR